MTQQTLFFKVTVELMVDKGDIDDDAVMELYVKNQIEAGPAHVEVLDVYGKELDEREV